MLANAKSCAVVGLDGFIVDVEVDIAPGLPRFDVVGLPDTAVQEARARVRAAVRNSGCEFPLRRITANLAPADVRKAGSTYDLPMAVALLQSSGQLQPVPEDAMFLGQLSLNGDVLHIDGVLPMVALGRESGIKKVFVPVSDSQEAALIDGIEVYPVESLSGLIQYLRGEADIAPVEYDESVLAPNDAATAFDISGIPRPGAREARAGGCGGGQSQPADERASGIGEDAARQGAAVGPPSAHTPGGDRGHEDILGGGRTSEGLPADRRAPLQVAASHHLLRGPGRGRLAARSGRDNHESQGRAVPGRAAGVRPPDSGSHAAAAGGPESGYQPRAGVCHLSGELHAGRGR